MSLVLIPSVGAPEILPSSVELRDVFSHASLFTQPISELVTMYWNVSTARGQQARFLYVSFSNFVLVE